MKKLSRSNKMSIITSIHQPNQDLFHMFDSVYVLAKGGVCVYSGVPQNLRQHLNECRIECNENQIPIEVIIKLSFNGLSDENVIKLMEETKTLNNFETNEMNSTKSGLITKSKSFRLLDFWTVLKRFFFKEYYMNFSHLTKVLIIFLSIILFLSNCFSEKISETDGCFKLNSTKNQTCIEIEDQKSILRQNQTYLICSLVISILYFSVLITDSYGRALLVFHTEYQNRE